VGLLKIKRKIIIAIVISILIVGFVFYNNMKGIEAEVIEIQPETIALTFEEEGEVVPTVDHPIYSNLEGEIINLQVEEGQHVKKGDLLAVIDTRELEFKLKQMQSELKSLQGERIDTHQKPLQAKIKSQELLVQQAQIDLKAFEDDFKRSEKLYDGGAITLKEYEDAKKMMEKAKINLKQQQESLALLYESHDPTSGSIQFYEGKAEALKSQIDLLKYQIQKCKITSSVEGVVADLAIKKGDFVNRGMRLMNIFQKDDYLIEAYVPDEVVHGIKKGMKVKLAQDRKGEDIIFEGLVEKTAPTAVEKITTLGLEEQYIKVTISPITPENIQLFPGTILDVEFTTDKKQDVIVVPKTALFPYKNGNALWVVENQRAKVQPVETGFENDTHIVILKGLKIGALVILDPQLSGLKEGKNIHTRFIH
jgi:HlyD family secretion protein